MSARFEPRELSLHDRRPACIRAVCTTDAAGLLAVEHALHEDGRGMVQPLSQVPHDAEAMEHRIARHHEDDSRLWLVAEALAPQPRIVGHATLHRLNPAYCAHVGVLALGVDPSHQGLGLGRALMQALIDHAPAMGLTRLELYVRADNHRARALYASLGFVPEGVRRNFIRLPDGTHIDDHILALLLEGTDLSS